MVDPKPDTATDEQLPEILRPGSTLASRKAARLKRIGTAENKAVAGDSLITSTKVKGSNTVPYPPLVDDAATADEQAAEAIRAYCGWHIAPVVTETLTVDGSGTWAQMLPTLHIVSIASVTEIGVLLDAALYDWSETGYLTKAYSPWDGYWTRRPRGVVVELTHGFATCPADLAGVAAAMSVNTVGAYRGTTETAGPFTVSGISALGQSGPFALGSYEQSVLDKYRIANLR